MSASHRLWYTLLGAVSCAFTIASHAWDNPGHMAVAGLAYDQLSPTEQSKLAEMLKQHPGIKLVTQGFPEGVPDDRALVMAFGTWPDLAKQSPDYVDNGYEKTAPAVQKVVISTDMHKGWHFIDTPLWLGTGAAPALPAVPQANAVGVVTVLKTQLKTTEAADERAYDLAWLLHLVGDIHQPLHAVTGVTTTLPEGDVGGNDVKIQGAPGVYELHAYWDDILGKTAASDKRTHFPRLDKDIDTADEIITSVKNLPLGNQATNLDPVVWAKESFAMAKNDVYDIDLKVVATEKGNGLEADLDANYHKTATKDAQRRIALAGHRLALILKDVLK